MAGPFASSGNQAQDIERVQLKGGFSPDAGAIGVVEAVLGVAVPALTEAHANDIKQDITDQTESVKQALLAAQNPALRGSSFTEEALANPVTAEAFKQFNLIQDAASSGKLPKQYALERLEEIQDTAIANNPAFEKEIRAAMVAATGVDPNKATFQQMLNKSAADLSPEAKAERRTRELAAFHGITYEEQLQFNNQGMRNTQAQNRLNILKSTGEYNNLHAGKEVNLVSGSILMDISGEISARQAAGTINDEFIASMKLKLSTEVQAATLVLTKASTGVSGTQLTATLQPLMDMEKRVAGMLDDGSFTKMVQNRVLFKKLMIEDNIMNMPDFAAAWALGGVNGFGALMDYMALAPTEASEEVIAAMSPRVRDAFRLRNISAGVVAKWFGNVGSGVKPETQEEKDAMRVASGLLLAADGVDEDVKASALQELRDLGQDHEWSAFESKKVVKATKNSLVLTAAMLSLQETTSTGLKDEYATLANAGKTQFITLQGGRLVFDFAANTEGKTAGTAPGVTNTSEELGFIARFNRANNISLLHSQAGSLPKARYTNAANYFTDIKGDADKDAPKQPTVKIRTVVLLPNGKYGFADGGE